MYIRMYVINVCMYVMHTYIHTYMHTYIHTMTHILTHILTHKYCNCMCMCIYTCVCIHSIPAVAFHYKAQSLPVPLISPFTYSTFVHACIYIGLYTPEIQDLRIQPYKTSRHACYCSGVNSWKSQPVW